MTDVSLSRSKRSRKANPSWVLSVLVVVSIAASVLAGSGAPLESNSEIKVANPNAVFPVLPVVANPGLHPDACKPHTASGSQTAPYSVTILLDRSSSVAPHDVPAYKSAVNSFLADLSNRARQENTQAYVNIFAFATYAIWQNNPDWLPVLSPFRNIADPTPGPFGLNALQLHQLLVNDIFFSQNRNIPYANPSTAYRGYRAVPNSTLYSLATNWHDAFSNSARMVRFWEGATQGPGRSLTVMFTDGVPTVNNDRNHIADNHNTLATTQTVSNFADFISARYGVNRLRTGAEYRDQNNNIPYLNPQYDLNSRKQNNVFGILVTPGTDINGVNADNVMDAVFGARNADWWRVPDYNNNVLNGITTGILDRFKCDQVIPIIYTPGLEIVSISTNPANRVVEELQGGSLSVTVRNTTTYSGPAGSPPPQPMRVTLTINGSTQIFNLSHGATASRTHTFSVDLGQIGNYSPDVMRFDVTATGTFNLGSPYQLAPNASNTVTKTGRVDFTIERLELPS